MVLMPTGTITRLFFVLLVIQITCLQDSPALNQTYFSLTEPLPLCNLSLFNFKQKYQLRRTVTPELPSPSGNKPELPSCTVDVQVSPLLLSYGFKRYKSPSSTPQRTSF